MRTEKEYNELMEDYKRLERVKEGFKTLAHEFQNALYMKGLEVERYKEMYESEKQLVKEIEQMCRKEK